MAQDSDPINIDVSAKDFQEVMNTDTVLQLRVTNVALIRMVRERDARIAELEAVNN